MLFRRRVLQQSDLMPSPLKLAPGEGLPADPVGIYVVGDVVRLNSGPLRMTVRRVAQQEITCRWHDETDDLLEDSFSIAELTIVRKSDQ